MTNQQKEITRQEFDNLHDDYKMINDEWLPYILELDEKTWWTVLSPVIIIEW